jgi:SAM-dependent methyltransferase
VAPDEPPFDAVLFTRSLHHIHPLAAALQRAHDLLVPDGRVVIEDWAWNRVDAATATWMYDLVADWQRRGLAPQDEFVRHCDADPDRDSSLASWIDEHERECHLHEDDAMRAAALACFEPLSEERVPYFFRYACRWLADRPDGLDAARRMLAAEREAIAARAIVPIGWRLVGVRREP